MKRFSAGVNVGRYFRDVIKRGNMNVFVSRTDSVQLVLFSDKVSGSNL
jgi:hypothetical protein